MKSHSLTAKQKKFADHWLIHHNATKAALAAKYNKRTADSQGSRLLKHVKIKAYIDEKERELQQKTDIDQQRVLLELGRIAFSDIRKYFTGNNNLVPITKLSDEAAAALGSVEIDELYQGNGDNKYWVGQTKKVRLNDKVRALDLLAKHLGMYKEGSGEVTLNLHIGYGKEMPV